jgi:hypothetical protein
MSRRLSRGTVVLAVAALAALGLYLLLRDSDEKDTTGRAGSASSPATSVPYNPIDHLLPPACAPTKVATAVMQFLDAFNRGDPGVLRFLAPLPEFRFYSIAIVRGNRVAQGGTVTKQPREILEYMRRRHREQERVRLLEIAVGEAPRDFRERPTTGPEGQAPVAAFDFEVTRTARDLPRSQLGGGKAAINCRTNKIFLWAQGWGNTPPDALICPKATIEPTSSSAVACAPGYRDYNEAVRVPFPASSQN